MTDHIAGLASRLRGRQVRAVLEHANGPAVACPDPVPVHLFEADRVADGTLCGTRERISDTVNRVTSLHVVDVTITELANQSAVTVPALDVALDQVLLIVPGDQPARERWIWTRRRYVEIAVGGWAVFGELHGPAASDPLANLHRRPSFVPLTDATIVVAATGASLAAPPVVIVNTAAAASIRDGEYDRNRRPVTPR